MRNSMLFAIGDRCNPEVHQISNYLTLRTTILLAPHLPGYPNPQGGA